MAPVRRKYLLDTNLYIDATTDGADRAALQGFLASHTPFVYLSAIVAQELRAGIAAADAPAFERAVTLPFVRRGRVLAPSATAWMESGAVLSALVEREGLVLATVTKSFANDVLLALTCREHGATLVTRNRRDFARLRRHVAFEFVEPWPAT